MSPPVLRVIERAGAVPNNYDPAVHNAFMTSLGRKQTPPSALLTHAPRISSASAPPRVPSTVKKAKKQLFAELTAKAEKIKKANPYYKDKHISDMVKAMEDDMKNKDELEFKLPPQEASDSSDGEVEFEEEAPTDDRLVLNENLRLHRHGVKNLLGVIRVAGPLATAWLARQIGHRIGHHGDKSFK